MSVVENKTVKLLFVTILEKKIQLSVPDIMSLNECVNYLYKDKILQLLGTEPVSALTSVSIYKNGSMLCSYDEVNFSLNKIDLKDVMYLQLVRVEDTYNISKREHSSEFEAIVNRHVSEEIHRQLQENNIDHTVVIDKILFVESILVFTVHDSLKDNDREIVKCKPNNIIYISFENYKKKYDIGNYTKHENCSIFNTINVNILPCCKEVLYAVRYWYSGHKKYDIVCLNLIRK